MLVSLAEYGKLHDRSPDTLRRLAEKGAFSTAQKIGRNWALHKDEPYPVKKRLNKDALNVLSLFSGCGGLDLGFEGGFDVIAEALNFSIHPDWNISDETNEGWKRIPKTRFNTVFANDIRPDAQIAWSKHFGKRGIANSAYHLASIVDLVKTHKAGENIFPSNLEELIGEVEE